MINPDACALRSPLSDLVLPCSVTLALVRGAAPPRRYKYSAAGLRALSVVVTVYTRVGAASQRGKHMLAGTAQPGTETVLSKREM